MSDEPTSTFTNPLSKTQLPSFAEKLDASQKNIIKGLWDGDNLSIFEKIHNIDQILKDMPLEARREYRKWRFRIDRTRMPSFYDSQNKKIKLMIAGIFKESTDLEEFAQVINSMKSSLNNPDEFDKWVKDEEIEFKEPPVQKDMKKESTSQPIAKITMDSSPSNPRIKTITNETNKNPNIRDAIAIDIGTSKCKIAICKEKYIQIVEHEANRSVPSYVALSEQGEWLVGRMAENYAVCLQNVIYDIRWLTNRTYNELKDADKKYFFQITSKKKDNEIVTFDMIDQGKEKSPKVLNAKEIFAKLLEPLFTTVYKNLQRPTTIAITVPIKSEENYKKLVKKCVESAKKDIVATMHSSTATPNIKLIDEPIAVAAAYAPRLNLHPKGDVALVFCMGAGYLQVAAYFIQEKTHQEKVSHWTDWVINKISAIEPIAKNFAGDDIDRLIFDKMMEKLTDQNGGSTPNLSERAERRLKIACEKMKCALSFAPHTRIDVDSLYRNGDEDCDLVEVIQKDEIVKYYNKEVDQVIKKVGKVYKEIKPKFILLAGGSTRIPLVFTDLSRVFKDSTVCNFLNVDEVAAIGAAAIVSKTVTMAEKFINYKEVIGIIKEQEEEEKKALMPDPAPAARPDQPAKLTPTVKPAPAATLTADAKSTPDAIPIQPARSTPADDTPILDKRHNGNNQSPKPKQSQPVSPPGSYSLDSPGKILRPGKGISEAVQNMRSKEVKKPANNRKSSTSQNTRDEVSKMGQSPQRIVEMNSSTDGNNVKKTIESTGSKHTLSLVIYSNSLNQLSNDRNVQSLPSSDVHTLRKAEGADPMTLKIQEQYSQSSSRNTVKMQYNKGLPDKLDKSEQSQGPKNNLHDKSQSHTYSSLNSKIGHNSRDQKLMSLSTSRKEDTKISGHKTSSAPLNSMNTGNPSQQNQDKSAISTSSNSNKETFPKADRPVDPPKNYNKWMRDSHGKRYIELKLSQLAPGQSGQQIYPIYPETLQGVLKVALFVPYETLHSQGYNRSPLNSAKFHGITEVRVNLENNSSKDRDNYKCHITIMGVDCKAYEVKSPFSPIDRRPLDIWKKSYILLELV